MNDRGPYRGGLRDPASRNNFADALNKAAALEPLILDKESTIAANVASKVGQLNDALWLAADAGLTTEIFVRNVATLADEGNRPRIHVTLERRKAVTILDTREAEEDGI